MYVKFDAIANRSNLNTISDIRNAIDYVLDGINADSGVTASVAPSLSSSKKNCMGLNFYVDISGGAKKPDIIKNELVSLMNSAGFTESHIIMSNVIFGDSNDIQLLDKNFKLVNVKKYSSNWIPQLGLCAEDERLLSPKALQLNHYHRYRTPIARNHENYQSFKYSIISDIEFDGNTAMTEEELHSEAIYTGKQPPMQNIDPFDDPDTSMNIQTLNARRKMRNRIKQSNTLPAPLLLVSDSPCITVSTSAGMAVSYIMRALEREGWLTFPAMAKVRLKPNTPLSEIEAIFDYMRGGVVLLYMNLDIKNLQYLKNLGHLIKNYSSKVCITICCDRADVVDVYDFLSEKLGFKCISEDVIEINCCLLYNPLKLTSVYDEECRRNIKDYLRDFGGNDSLIDSFIFSLNKIAYYKDELAFEYLRYISLYSENVTEDDEIDEYLHDIRNFSFYDGNDDYDPSKNYIEELGNLIGLKNAKDSLNRIIKESKMRKKRGTSDSLTRKHMAFLGNPGTGKTTVAKLFAYALRQNGCLDEKNPCAFYAVGSTTLIGKYQGHSSPAVQEVFEKGKGAVIFIDEAYDLAEQCDFGRQAINEIVRQMEIIDPRTIVIFGGYTDETQNMLKLNRGLESRVRHCVMFDDYTVDQLVEIARRKFRAEKLDICEEGIAIMKAGVQKIYDELGVMAGRELGNARFIENVVNDIITEQCVRVCDVDEDNISVTVDDVRKVMDRYLDVYTSKAAKCRVGF